MSGSPGTPATRATRPPTAGPISRYLSALNSGGPPFDGASGFCALTFRQQMVPSPRTRRSLPKRPVMLFILYSLLDVRGRDVARGRVAPPEPWKGVSPKSLGEVEWAGS